MTTQERGEMIEASSWDNILASPWCLSIAGSFLSFADLKSLTAVSKGCRDEVLAWVGTWPDNEQGVFRYYRNSKPAKVLVFGVHSCEKEKDRMPHAFFKSTPSFFRNPTPIIQFKFASMAFDSTEAKLVGGYSEFNVENATPASLGRIYPNVCAANESGSEIFYCGGDLCALSGAERWLQNSDMDDISSSATALFSVETSSWKVLPSMPRPSSQSGICRIRSRVYIIGGETNFLGVFATPRPTRAVVCFDLIQEEWIESGIPDYPGQAYCGFAVVPKDETTILVAGGKMVTGQSQYGPLIGPSRAAFSLNIETGIWTRLADLPENNEAEKQCSGFLLKNTNTEATFAVASGKQVVHLLPTGRWEALPSLEERDGCVVSLGNAIVKFEAAYNEMMEFGSWASTCLPPKRGGDIFDFGLRLVDSTGEPIFMCFGRSSTGVVVRPK